MVVVETLVVVVVVVLVLVVVVLVVDVVVVIVVVVVVVVVNHNCTSLDPKGPAAILNSTMAASTASIGYVTSCAFDVTVIERVTVPSNLTSSCFVDMSSCLDAHLIAFILYF